MNLEEKLYQLALYLTPGVGDFNIRQLIAYCGSAQKVLETPLGKLKKVPGVGPKTIQSIKSSDLLKKAEDELIKAEKSGATLCFFTDPIYPERLKLIPDSPALLYFKGAIESLNQPRMVSIVGTRNATGYGKGIVEELVSGFIGKNILIVSGLAYGIDIQAHRMALKYGLATIGVMASGLDIIYPTVHKETAKAMLEFGGLLTEQAFGVQPEAHYFPARNRIIAGLSDAMIVVEAGTKGGALITAEIGNSYDREVYAVPGNLNNNYSEGCNHLIKNHKARILLSPDQLLEEMNWQSSNSKSKKIQSFSLKEEDFDQDEWKVIQLLLKSGKSLQLDELCWATQISLSKLSGILLQLEFKGLIRNLPGKQFALVG
jgi:DNA processing protein